MNTRTPKVEENKPRSVGSSVAQNKEDGKQGFGFVDNRSYQLFSLGSKNIPTLSQFKTLTSPMGNSAVVQRNEFASATCTVAGTSKTATSKSSPSIHWVTRAMNEVATVNPKIVTDGEGNQTEQEGNAKFQCAEPKSLSMALSSGLNKKEQITKAEVDNIKWSNIKWCNADDPSRDGQPACTCPTCTSWLDSPVKGSAKPSAEAKASVKTIGESSKLFFKNDSERIEYNEQQQLEADKEQRRVEQYQKYGQYINILRDVDCEEPYHEITVRIDNHRELLVSFIDHTEEIETIETDITDLNYWIENGDSKRKSSAKAEKIELEGKIEVLESKRSKILESVLA